MTASPEVLAAFEAWKLAELASHYASPCPDEVMEALVERENVMFNRLIDLPPTNADDMLLKLFPILLHEWEPRSGDLPLRPHKSRAYQYPATTCSTVVNDLGALSDAIARAMRAPLNPIYAAAE